MKNVKPVGTPLAGHMNLSKQMCPTVREEKESMSKVPYSFIVGSLIYIMICTRPDIANAVGGQQISKKSRKKYWKAVKWTL